jgi:uncharacterized protein (TIGR02231 family)
MNTSQQTLTTVIEAVSVFSDRARVTRKGSVSLTAGSHVLELKNLPVRLIEDSVRAAGRGQGIRITGLDTNVTRVIEAPEENIAALDAELESLKAGDAELRDEDASLTARLETIKSLAQCSATELAKGIAYGRATVETAQSVAAYVTGESDATLGRKREIAKGRADLAKKIEAVNARLARVRQPSPQERRSIVVSVDAPDETEFALEVTYMVTGASWSPQYDLRLEGGSVTATYLASITQKTGEDWPSVYLSLSTARPAVTKSVPELSPWYLDQALPPPPPRPPAALAAAPAPIPPEFMKMSRSVAPAAAMPEPPAPPARFSEASVEASGLAVTYRVAKPANIPSDGSPHRALIAITEFPARLDYVTAPKIACEAYLRAKVTNSSSLILLPGKANIFHGDEFTGSTQLKNIAPREEFELQLGVDDRIKVERELLERDVSKTFIGNNRRVLYAWVIRLNNLLDHPARITVMDQIPHSRREEIKVKQSDATPRATEQTDLGVQRWELTIPAQQKSEIRFGYSIESPRDWRIAGLPD